MMVSKLEDRLEEVQANGGSMQQSMREPNFFNQGGGANSAQQRGRRATMERERNNDSLGISWLDSQGNGGGAQGHSAVRKEFQSQFKFQQHEEEGGSAALDHSPFRGQTKKSKTPHPPNGYRNEARTEDYSPMKGKIDPNLNSYARQNAHKNQGQQEQLATMTVHELINYKQDVSQDLQKATIC